MVGVEVRVLVLGELDQEVGEVGGEGHGGVFEGRVWEGCGDGGDGGDCTVTADLIDIVFVNIETLSIRTVSGNLTTFRQSCNLTTFWPIRTNVN